MPESTASASPIIREQFLERHDSFPIHFHFRFQIVRVKLADEFPAAAARGHDPTISLHSSGRSDASSVFI
jgi:hypothetical protein